MTDTDRQEMLAAIGVQTSDELFRDIPAAALVDALDLPAPLSELELTREMQTLAAVNHSAGEMAFFRGGGIYRRYIPAVVDEVLRRGEFLTSYTPYQAEASQGTLQAAFEFQSMICDLYAMDVANAGMYDGASALAEACLMACRATNRDRLALADTINPQHVEVVRTYTQPQGIAVDRFPSEVTRLNEHHACLVVQSPDYYGRIALADEGPSLMCGDAGALLVVSADPMSTALFQPPGALGADVVVGEGQSLGLPLSYGGPYIGLFTTRRPLLRLTPGRIVGQTTDVDGKRGFVLTLQAREQHIRRERASSNICTSEQLLALAISVYLACLGAGGLRRAARLCYDKAHYAAERIETLPGWRLSHPGTVFFQEFAVDCPLPVAEVNRLLRRRDIVGGIDVSDGGVDRMLLCVTETNTREEIDRLIEALGRAGGGD
jgi:glycine dehydrogenase subunit 1